MRLVCPNCDAKYEVPDDAVPEGGRDVQCSSCGHASATGTEAEPAEAEVPPADTPPRRDLDDGVLAILREEAEREKSPPPEAQKSGAHGPRPRARCRSSPSWASRRLPRRRPCRRRSAVWRC
ncbi:MAG: zinc-ribbon domain-containing protein [Rhodobacter sp.]|nr:zinc-ribbon domain-containing protein [Rhodobacter sp.]